MAHFAVGGSAMMKKEASHPSTRRALASRALVAADSLEHWVKHLEGEMKKQNIGLSLDYDNMMTFTLRRWEVRRLVYDMRSIIDQIRKFKPN
jgi:hypothetical protein